MIIVQPVIGLAVLIAVAWALSEDRRGWSTRLVLAGVAAQIVVALVALSVPPIRDAVQALNGVVLALDAATKAGTGLVFGYLGGGPLPFEEPYPGAAFVLAFQALPIVLFMSALSAVLWHWRLLPTLIRGMATLLRRSVGVDGPVALGAAANIFAGMVEAALLIRPHLASMSRSDLFVTMTCGLSTIAGTVLVLYATFLSGIIEGAAGHLVVASLISAPAAIVVARLMVPEERPPVDTANENAQWAEIDARTPALYASTMDALVQGTQDGVRLLLNIIATLIVFVAAVALVNQILGLAPDLFGAPLSLERLLGWALAPMAWLLGIPWAEAGTAGAILGTKIVLNELLAYLQLAGLEEGSLSDRSELILLYALCSFANFGSVGIMLAGLVAMAPERKAEFVELGLKALVAGTIATSMTGAVVALVTAFGGA